MPPRNSVKLIVDENFKQWGDSAMSGIMRKLEETVPLAAKAAASAEVAERTGALKGSIHVLPIQRSGDTIQAGIGASDYKANWYEQGTLARRSKAIKHSRTKSQAAKRESHRKELRASGSQSGVKALHFLRKGLYAARTVIFHEIGVAMRNARAGL